MVSGPDRGPLASNFGLDDPQRTTATGTLDAEGTDLLERWGVPATIERLHLEATGAAARVSDTAIVIAGQRLALAGTVERRQTTYAIDARVTAGDLDPARLAAALRGGETSAMPSGPAGEWNLPVEGKVALTATSVALGAQVLRSVAATAALSPQRVVADVTDARCCDVALPFTAVLRANHIAVDGKAQARGQALAPTVSCLVGEPIGVSGSFDLDATLAGSGPPDRLRETLQGSFQLTARAGRVRRLPVVDHILRVGAVAERTHPSVSEEGASSPPDSRIAVGGTFAGNQVRIDRATLDKPFLGIAISGEARLADRTLDMQGLVAPLTPINEALRHVPLVGELAGVTIVGIPVRVTGRLQEPTVTLVGPGAVGRGLVELMGATLKAPVALLDPLLGAQRTGP